MISAPAERKAPCCNGNPEPSGQGGLDGQRPPAMGGEFDAGPDDQPRLPVNERIVGRRDASYSVKPESAGSEGIEVEASLRLHAIAVPLNVVLPGQARAGENRDLEIRA